MPAHWKIERGRWLFTRLARPVQENASVVTCFRDGAVTLRSNRRVTGFTESLQEIGYQGVSKGDLVIHAMDAFAGAVGVSDSDGKCSPIYSVCTPRVAANPKYYAYLIREMARSRWIAALARGIRERSTDFRFETFATQRLPVPPLSEQVAIVRFLDYDERRIQRAILAKKRLIALLSEQKATIIHQAVTRGRDPTVPLKPSGVEWLGDVPEQWESVRLKLCARMISKGSTPSTREGEILEAGPVRFLKAENLVGGEVADSPSFYIRHETHDVLRRSQLEEFDILFVIAGTLGKTAVVGKDLLPANLNQAIAFIRPNERIAPEYLAMYLQAPHVKSWTWLQAVQSAQPNISMHDLGNFYIPLPPLAEQRDIVAHLRETLSHLDAAADLANREAHRLQEFRTRLIADVVTGKLDVRVAATASPGQIDDGEPDLENEPDEVAPEDDLSEIAEEEAV